MKPDKNYNPIGIIHNQKFKLFININEKLDEVDEKYIGFWRNAVWISSGWLWWVWLSHDVANIAVYLPRQ